MIIIPWHLEVKLVHGVLLAAGLEGGVPGEVLLVLVPQVGPRLNKTSNTFTQRDS